MVLLTVTEFLEVTKIKNLTIESKLDVLMMKEEYMRTENSKKLSNINICIAIRWWGAVSYTGWEKNRNCFSWRRRGWWTV